MKKAILVFALCAAVLSGFSATLMTINDPIAGKVTTINEKASGKLSAVDVFSSNETGTFNLSRIFSTDIFTNAYDITHTVDTNVTVTPVYDENFYLFRASDSTFFSNKVNGVAIGSYNGTYDVYQSDGNSVTDFVWNVVGTTRWVYLHGGYVSGGRLYPGWGEEGTYDEDEKTVMTNGIPIGIEKIFPYVGDNYSTNFVHHYVTNSFWPVLKNKLVVTNDIFSAACSNHCFHGKPDPDVYLFKGDKIIFTGTATGGSHRLVIE